MPDSPPGLKPVRPLPRRDSPSASAEAGYAELHCKTNFSFLEGASHPDELVQRSVELGIAALAVTDRNSLAGVVRAHVAAKAVSLPLIIGAEMTPTDGSPVVLWAADRAGYGRLSTLITLGRRRAPKGQCLLTRDDVAQQGRGLLAGVILRSAPDESLRFYRDVFGDRAYGLAALHCERDDPRTLAESRERCRRAGLPLLAGNDVHYHVRGRQPLQDVLTAIRRRQTVAELGAERFSNGERCLKSAGAMRRLFADCPEAVARTLEVAQRCRFSLDELRYEYPRELCPAGLTPAEHLRRLTWNGARERYPQGVPDSVRQTIEHELALIEELRYEAYFLTVWDLVWYARGRGILCQGRGSAANSAVCYCLGVTSVDPARIDLLFERFISRERGEAPDIDVDFEHERREEVLQYLYEKYGRDRAGLTATLITYRPRSAVRDVGRALGLSLDRVDRLAKNLDHYGAGEELEVRFREAGLDLSSRPGRQLLTLTRAMLGFPRHLSQHVGGMVMTEGPLHELAPIENAAMPGRTVLQWDKDDLDALGLLKVDCLCLGMLTAIRKSFDLIQRHDGRALTLASVPAEDPTVYEMIGRADTVGVFQIESRAQMSMLPRLRPREFYDLVIEVAIVRPGPIQGDMVHPYLRRKRGEEPVTFPDERIRAVLQKTLGVPLFQEQAMKLAIVAAGFTPGEADQLRRAMAAWKKKGGLTPFRDKLIDGMTARGYEAEFAERLYKQICGFGEYGFPESHAASFALLAYVSAWLKRHHPAAFTAALINSQPMGFYAPAQLVDDLRRHGVEVRPVDINHSAWDCDLEPAAAAHRAASPWALRLGLRMISGLPETTAQRLVAARQQTLFTSIEDAAQRAQLSRGDLLRLARADACASLRLSRRSAFWSSLPARDTGPLLQDAAPIERPAPLPTLAPFDEVAADYRALGLSLKAHPFSFLRDWLKQQRVCSASDLQTLPDGAAVRVAGLVLLRQRPGTAKGVTFVTIEDETGQVNLIVWQRVWEQHRRAARQARAFLIDGHVQQAEGILHVVVRRIRDLSGQLTSVPHAARDFR